MAVPEPYYTTAFTSYFLRKISWVSGKSFLLYARLKGTYSLAGRALLNTIIWKFPKNMQRGRHKCPRGSHVALGPRVWDSCVKATEPNNKLEMFGKMHFFF